MLKLKADQEFIWGEEQQLALDVIKSYLTNPPVLIPPQQGKPFRLYLSTNGMFIGSALIQEFEGKERVIYYLSRRLIDAETRYSAIEKLCLCLYFSCTKLRNDLLSTECTVVCKDDVVRYMLSMPIMSGRIVLTPFLDTRPGWQDKVAVCCLQDELPMKMVADEGEVGHD